MKTLDPKASPVVSFPPEPLQRHRFILRADGGFLRASHELAGPPITTTHNAVEATRFVDCTTAARRGAALEQLGWRNLRVVEVALRS